MLRYLQLSSVMLAVSDLGRARAFYERLPGLEAMPGGRADRVRFHAGDYSATLELAVGRPGLRGIAFQMESAASLEELRGALDRNAVPWKAAGTGIRIVDVHTGARVDFQEPVPGQRRATGGAIEGFGHVVLATDRCREAVAFWRDVLGFRLSDEIEGRISLLRCFPNPQHHALGIANGARRRFHHLNFRVADATDFAAIARRFTADGVRIASGPGIHAPSGNTFMYFYDPDGLTLEFATSKERFVEGRERAPRVLPDVPESFALGGVRRHPAMFAVGEIEMPAAAD